MNPTVVNSNDMGIRAIRCCHLLQGYEFKFGPNVDEIIDDLKRIHLPSLVMEMSEEDFICFFVSCLLLDRFGSAKPHVHFRMFHGQGADAR